MGRHGLLLICLSALLALAGAWWATAPAHADGPVVRDLVASPNKILANGGRATVTVSVSGAPAGGVEVALSTTLGAFGAAGGPSRIILQTGPGAGGGSAATTAATATATTDLFGDGRRGTAVITARAGESVRSSSVVMAGQPASIAFESPTAGAVLSAAIAQPVAVQVRDEGGVTVPGVDVVLSTNGGLLSAPDQRGDSMALISDDAGRVSAKLRAQAGSITVRAEAGEVSTRVSVTLHGPAVSVQLVALRSRINLGDDPFPAPDGTIVAILTDDGGRPVPVVLVTFETDQAGVVVDHSGSGESPLTDSGGRARGHISAADAVATGVVTATARASGLEASVEVQIVGPPEQIALSVTGGEGGVYQLEATVRDAGGVSVPNGFHVLWEALAVEPPLEASFDPAESTVRDGTAETALSLSGGDASDVRVRATVLESDPPLSGALALATPASEGVPLNVGLNTVTWRGLDRAVADAVAPILPLVSAVWRFDDAAGWQGYFPSTSLGRNFSVVAGDRLYVFLTGAATLPDVDLVSPAG